MTTTVILQNFVAVAVATCWYAPRRPCSRQDVMTLQRLSRLSLSLSTLPPPARSEAAPVGRVGHRADKSVLPAVVLEGGLCLPCFDVSHYHCPISKTSGGDVSPSLSLSLSFKRLYNPAPDLRAPTVRLPSLSFFLSFPLHLHLIHFLFIHDGASGHLHRVVFRLFRIA